MREWARLGRLALLLVMCFTSGHCRGADQVHDETAVPTDPEQTSTEAPQDTPAPATEEPLLQEALTKEQEEEEEEPPPAGILLVALGGGEDELAMAQMASLLHHNGHQVTAILYGPGPREERFPPEVKVLQIGVSEADPLYPGGTSSAVTPGEEEGVEWVSGRVFASRVLACAQFSRLPWVEAAFRRARLVVSPLFLHDLCVLTLAQRVGVPVVGVVTSRVGAWWVWDNLGTLPPLATTPVPPSAMQELTIWARAGNIARHYGYVSTLRQQWQVPALTALDPSWTPPPLDTLYASLARVVVTWDPLLDAHLPHTPLIVPVGGFHYSTGFMSKDVLVPALLNRAGVLLVSVGGREASLGPEGLSALHDALKHTSYTVLWKTSHPSLRPNVTAEDEATATAKFLYKEEIPLSNVLSHPRHRILVSACGDVDAMAASYYGSPTLCLPVTTDQKLAAASLQKIGLAEVVPAAEVTVSTVKQALSKLAVDRSYRDRGRKIAEDLHDQSLSPADRLLFVLERVLRRPRSLRFKPAVSSLYLLQQSNADVYLLLLILLTTLLGVLFAIAIVTLPILLKKQKAKSD